MDKILSQEEISALFSAMSSEGLALGAATETGGSRKVGVYDFRRADRISQEQMRQLHLLHDYFGRNFSASLSAYLRAYADVSLISVDQMPYSEFLKLLPDPTLFASVGLRPLDSNAAMELNPSLVFPMIDMLLGGPGNPSSGERTLTEIEMNIIEGVLKLILKDLKEAWRPILELDLSLEGCDTKPQMFQVVAPGETVVTVSFRINVGENSGMLNICIPSRLLKVIRSKFDQQWHIRRQKVGGGDSGRILDLIRSAPMGLRGQVRPSRLTVDDVMAIGVGDVLALEQRVDDPVLLCVAGMPKFLGRIVVRRGKKAFEITGRVSE
jgi:flagellar motor switch protein FliM